MPKDLKPFEIYLSLKFNNHNIPTNSKNSLYLYCMHSLSGISSTCGSAGKEPASDVEDLGSIPGLGRSPGEGKGYPLQYSDHKNSMGCIVMGSQRVGHD